MYVKITLTELILGVHTMSTCRFPFFFSRPLYPAPTRYIHVVAACSNPCRILASIRQNIFDLLQKVVSVLKNLADSGRLMDTDPDSCECVMREKNGMDDDDDDDDEEEEEEEGNGRDEETKKRMTKLKGDIVEASQDYGRIATIIETFMKKQSLKHHRDIESDTYSEQVKMRLVNMRTRIALKKLGCARDELAGFSRP